MFATTSPPVAMGASVAFRASAASRFRALTRSARAGAQPLGDGMAPASSLLVITGLRKEAKAATGPGIVTVCSGGDSARLRSMLATIDPTPFFGVVSFGIAGGLDPALLPGDILVGTGVSHGEQRHCAANELSSALSCALAQRSGLTVGRADFVGSDTAVICTKDKAALRAQTGAAAVDMESHVTAAWAATHGLPFSILRVVSDPAHRALPALAACALTPDGRVDLRRVVAGLARRPRQLAALADAGRDARAAFAALGRCRGLFGPLLSLEFVDL